MYSRKKIPAPFGKPQKTAEKKKEATTVLPQKETSKEPIFLHAEEKTIPARLCLHCCCWNCFPQKKMPLRRVSITGCFEGCPSAYGCVCQ